MPRHGTGSLALISPPSFPSQPCLSAAENLVFTVKKNWAVLQKQWKEKPGPALGGFWIYILSIADFLGYILSL